MPDWLYNLRRNATDSIRSELETEHAGLLLTNQEILFIDQRGVQRAPLLEVAKVGRSGSELIVGGRTGELIRGQLELDKDSLGAFFKKAQEVTIETRKRAELELIKAQETARAEAERARLEAEAKAQAEAEAQANAERAKLGRTPGVAVGPRPEELLARGEKFSTKTIVETAPSVGFDDFPVQNAPDAPSNAYFDYAPLGARFLALLIDGFILGLINRAISGLFNENESAALLGVLATLFAAWLYYAVTESSPMQSTIGKNLMGLMVVGQKHERIGLAAATLRWFIKFFAPAATVLIALIAFLPTIVAAAQQSDVEAAQGAVTGVLIVSSIGLLVSLGTFIAPIFTPGRRALHDFAAQTILVRR
jgi:uncharacterized RDD family membrane protein YckC